MPLIKRNICVGEIKEEKIEDDDIHIPVINIGQFLLIVLGMILILPSIICCVYIFNLVIDFIIPNLETRKYIVITIVIFGLLIWNIKMWIKNGFNI